MNMERTPAEAEELARRSWEESRAALEERLRGQSELSDFLMNEAEKLKRDVLVKELENVELREEADRMRKTIGKLRAENVMLRGRLRQRSIDKPAAGEMPPVIS